MYVEVEDVNDNVPQTVDPAYYPRVQEGAPEGTVVLQLEAHDADALSSPPPGGPGGAQSSLLVYDITAGNPQGFFTIDRKTGECRYVVVQNDDA